MPLAETVAEFPLWLIVAVAVCLPVCAVVFWRIGGWWVTSGDVPLPTDRAVPAVRWPAEVGLAIFAGMVFLMPLVGWSYRWAADADLVPWEPLSVPWMFSPGLFLSMIVPPLAGLAVVLMFGRGAAETVCVRIGSAGRGVLTGAVAFAAILPVCLAALQANRVIMRIIQVPEELHPLLLTIQEKPEAWMLPVAVLEAAVLAPLSEEFMYRGVLLVTLLKRTGAAGAIVISSAIFALVHVPAEPQAVLPLFFLGMALAYAAYRTRSLVAPIVAHALFNGLMVLGIYLGGS